MRRFWFGVISFLLWMAEHAARRIGGPATIALARRPEPDSYIDMGGARQCVECHPHGFLRSASDPMCDHEVEAVLAGNAEGWN